MGLLRSLLLAPLSGPVQGLRWIAGQITDAADAEMNSPDRLRRDLQALEQALIAGQITEEVYEEAEQDLLIRLRTAR